MVDTAAAMKIRLQGEKSISFAVFALAVCGLYAGSRYSFLLFHSLVEIFCVFVMLAVFVLTWNSRRLLEHHYFLFLAISFLPAGAFELVHTFAYKGFGVFPGNDANLPTELWIAFRYTLSIAFFVAPLFVARKIHVALTTSAIAALTVGLFLAVFSGAFPDCFVEGQGLTPFKIVSEYIIIGIFLAATIQLHRKKEAFDPRVVRTLTCSIMCAAAAEAAFTRYISVYGSANLLGHYLLLLSAFLVYRAIVVTGIREPAAILFRSLEQSNEALKNSEELYRAFFHSPAVGTAHLGTDGRFLQVNDRFCRIIGYGSDELMGMTMADLSHPDDRQQEEQRFSAYLHGNEPVYKSESRYLRKDGRTIWIQVSMAMARDTSSNGSLRSAAIMQDITQRKEVEEQLRQTAAELQKTNTELAESRQEAVNLLDQAIVARQEAEAAVAALQESEARLSLALRSAQMGVWRLDLTEQKRYFDDTVCRCFGIDPVLFGGSAEEFYAVVHPDDHATIVNAMQKTINSGVPYQVEYRVVWQDGQIRHITSRGRLAGNGCIPTRWIEGLAWDITERKQSEEALQKANLELAVQMEERVKELQEKEVLLKEVHHRVKNNMQVISSLVSLQARATNDEAVREVLREVTYRVRSMALVHEKLYRSTDLARIDFAGYARSLLESLWRSHGVAASGVRLNLDLEPVPLSVDLAVPCGLILNELAVNALKHAFGGMEQGEVTLSLKTAPEDSILMQFSDNGAGLPAGLEWRRAESLGLRLVHMLSDQLRAAVEVTADCGTTFTFIFGHGR